MLILKGALASILFTFCATVSATVINYSVDSLGGNSYQYTYTVTNDTLAVDIDEFTVYFDHSLYENIVVGSAPADWDPIAIQPDVGLPDAGFYDALALVFGVAPGDSLSGFLVSFDWLGAGTPGEQDFEVYDIGFNLLDTGTTTVAEPGALALLGFGFLSLLLQRKAKS